MAHFLRGKQAGVQKDLSAGFDPNFFAIDQVCPGIDRYIEVFWLRRVSGHSVRNQFTDERFSV